jgi:putative Mn2+ efflux pump MntP
MLIDAFKDHKEDADGKKDPTKAMSLVMLSVATSIDALAIGFSISMLEVSIVFPAIVIGLVAIIFTVIGLFLGTKLGSSSKLSTYAEIIGGVVLLCIGVNILFEHGVLFF